MQITSSVLCIIIYMRIIIIKCIHNLLVIPDQILIVDCLVRLVNWPEQDIVS